ncbi:MAG: HDOD domain-containing protein [Planctomycetota bacterium]
MSYRNSVLRAVRELRNMPHPHQDLVSLLQDGNADIDEVCRALTFDPGLTAVILAAANKTLRPGEAGIYSLRAAVQRLGPEKLAAQVLSASIRPLVEAHPLRYFQGKDDVFWKHSVVLALCAEELASETGVVAPTDAFTAALLADVGKLATDQGIDYDGLKALRTARKEAMLADAERELFDIDHAEASALLLKSWGLPESMLHAIRYHHRPDDCPPASQALADVIQVAQFLCCQLGEDLGFDSCTCHVANSSVERLHCSQETLELIQYRVCGYFDEVMAAFLIRPRAA